MQSNKIMKNTHQKIWLGQSASSDNLHDTISNLARSLEQKRKC